MDLDTFNKAIEKLIAQGAATVDMAGNVRRVGAGFAAARVGSSYAAQIAFRRAQIDRMVAFAETQQCRMTALIRHFGDTADGHRPCGNCDFCSPADGQRADVCRAHGRRRRANCARFCARLRRATVASYGQVAHGLSALGDRTARRSMRC